MESNHPDNIFGEAVIALEKTVSIFLDQLSAERDFLLNGEVDKLSDITKDKQQTLNELISIENRIRHYLPQINNDEPSESSSSGTAKPKIQQHWNELTNLLVECQKINAENGALVNTKLKQTKNALEHLYSLSNLSNPTTYNEQGNQQFFSQSNRSVQV